MAEADPELVYFFSVNYLCYTVICQYGEEFAAAHPQLYTEGGADEAIARYIESATSRTDTDGPFFYSLLSKGLVRENVARVYQNYAEQLAKQRDRQERTAVIASLKSTANQVRIIKINDVDQMDGVEFESLVAALFRKMGFKTVLTPATSDQGIDVVADNGERKIGIQAKCYSGPVGNGAVQEAYSGAKYYKCTEAMVITNNTFTLAARKLADSCGVILVDRVALASQLAVFPLRAS